MVIAYEIPELSIHCNLHAEYVHNSFFYIALSENHFQVNQNPFLTEDVNILRVAVNFMQ